MTGKTEENDMGRKKQISDQQRLHRERMRLQKGVFSSLATAQINRRTVFDEIIEEAKLRRSTSGRNPFELA